MIRCFRDTARQLLDELVELRRGPDRVTVHILLILEPSIGVRQRADRSCHGVPVVHWCSSLMTWEVFLLKR